MRTRPNAVELMHIAEKTLANEVVPDLSGRQRYNVALIASAMGIARREIEGGPTAYPGELKALQDLYGVKRGEDPAEAVDRLNRRFAADLRAGAYDKSGRTRKIAVNLMCSDVLARLAEDNPRYQR